MDARPDPGGALSVALAFGNLAPGWGLLRRNVWREGYRPVP
jgi:hypothetical protein